MNGILNFSIHFNVVHRKVDWQNPKMKSLNSMPDYMYIVISPHSSTIRNSKGSAEDLSYPRPPGAVGSEGNLLTGGYALLLGESN